MKKKRRWSPEDLLSEAIQCFQAGKLPHAEKLCRKVLSLHPNHADTLNLIGLLRANRGDFKSATKFLLRVVKNNENNDQYQVNLGNVFAASGDIENAKKAFESAVALKPKNVIYLIKLATANMHLMHWTAALKILFRTLELAPKDASIYAHLGVTFQEMNDIPAAIEAYETAIDFGFDDPQTYFNLGTAYSRIPDLAGAIKAYKNSIRLAPDSQNAYRNLGDIYVKIADYTNAIPVMRRAMELGPDNIEMLSDFGSALIGVKHFDEAISVYQQALQKDPQSALRWTDLAFAHLCASNPKEALSAATSGTELIENHTASLAFKSTALNHLERREEAGFLLNFKRLILKKQFNEVEGFKGVDDFNAVFYDHIRNSPTLAPSKLSRGLVGGATIPPAFMQDNQPPVINALQSMINSAIADYKDNHPVDPDHPFLIRHPRSVRIQWWANIIQSSGFLDTHFHPIGWLSGVYYPKLPDAVHLHADSNEGCIEFGREYSRIASDDEPPIFVVKPEQGLMVLFPSYFGHRTFAFESTQDRMSVAFDVIVDE